MAFLDSSQRPSAIIGAVAVVARGFSRLTADIDASLVAERTDVPALLRLARRSGLTARVSNAARFAEDNLVMLLRHEETDTPVDVSLAMQGFELDALRGAEQVAFGAVPIRIPSLSAMFIYKMVAGRPKDLTDVEALLATGAKFDATLVEKTLAEFDALLDLDRETEFRALVDASRSERRS